MAKHLVIVESPAKAKTIEKFLGPGHKVMASYGHVRALPSKQGSVDISHDFEPIYRVLPESRRHIEALKKEVDKSDELILATDPDREGEAIAWHLLEALGLPEGGEKPRVKRVVFHEITKNAVKKAMENPRRVAGELVDAQQARAVLDYLVGFNLSPFLWKKIRYGLSAGRVQSVALRLICEREKEIQAFKAQEYWTIDALLSPQAKAASFKARLHSLDGERLDKFAIADEKRAQSLVKEIETCTFSVRKITQSEKKRNPAPPFTTSTLQQEASRKLGYSARKTMSTAQKLYEGVDIGEGAVGLITYMRTDSVALSEEATGQAREVITKLYGGDYALPQPRVFRSRAKNAQEAHEAVRPTNIANTPDKVKPFLTSDQYRLYRLIWMRTVASQMAAAILDSTSVDIAAGERFMFRASGQVIRFPGFMKLYIEGTDDSEEEKEGTLPALAEGEGLTREDILPEQHFTQPPPRYTEASLVKTLEEYGIGRPSTYASIMNTLVTRKYVRLEKRTFFPEDVGMVVNDLLTQHFPRYVDYAFTAKMEEELDAISRGEQQWRPAIREFWDPFIGLLKQKEQEVSKADVTTEKTDRNCPDCGKALVVKLGRAGKFLACSGFPECRYTEALGSEEKEEPVLSDQTCDKCQAPMLIKEGRYGKFLACSAYPECKNIQPLVKPKALGITCPECQEGELMEKKSRYGKIFYSCNRYPKCKYALWDLPLAQACPKCRFPVTVEKTTKREGTVRKCPQDACDWKEVLVPPAAKPAAAKTTKTGKSTKTKPAEKKTKK
ncbi:type I DNA topoisomerase [Geoalkalibacter halelectricus]|uniref:DNA topoisomerase 1 n=1 Tax=Geoalkalibacter halelectricus TaxID=2847045 RepID=A0ABY5ZSE5_9BACT|nr:type I DNA topoisomerase [Geoalkalibacter halelectricus]MDO3377461.1 type I DNA topoisomerase [Geoalkalibacter halelectricus]UWZ80780.1 type I DNA topoisomerase [Geoalkalibacter halelectricus]